MEGSLLVFGDRFGLPCRGQAQGSRERSRMIVLGRLADCIDPEAVGLDLRKKARDS